jgi:outer membrane protein TolC
MAARPDILTLPRAQQLLFERNYDIQIAEQKHLQSISEATEAQASWYPTAELFAGYSVQSRAARLTFERDIIQENALSIPPFIDTTLVDTFTLSIDETIGDRDRAEAGTEISYPVFLGMSRTHTVKARQQAVIIRDLQRRRIENSLSLRIGTLFFRWELADAEVRTQRSLVSSISEHAAQMRNLYEGGMLSYSKVLEATAGLESAKLHLLELESRLDSLSLEAASLLRLQDTALAVSPYSFERLYNQYPPSQRGINDQRPELAILDHALKQNAHARKALDGDNYPHAYLNVAYRIANPGVNLGANEFVPYGTLGLQVRWTMYDGMKRHARGQQITYARQILKIQRDQQLDFWRKEIRQADMQLEKARRMEAAADISLKAAKEYESELSHSLSAGLIAPMEYVHALNGLAKARLSVERARALKKTAFLRLMYARGESIRF